jgi:hypothetical protein
MGYRALEAIMLAKKDVVDISFSPKMPWRWITWQSNKA